VNKKIENQGKKRNEKKTIIRFAQREKRNEKVRRDQQSKRLRKKEKKIR